MENIKNINLKNIKENIYFLENYKIQLFINNIYIDIYDKINNINNLDFKKTFYNLFNDKKLNNLVNKNLYEEINDNEFYFYYNYFSQNSNLYNIQYNNIIQYNINNSYFINILLNVLTYYIFNFNKDKIDDYINILKNNIVSSNVITNINNLYSSNTKINMKRIYFNKNLFEEINKLNLDIKIILYNINPYNNIINDISFSEGCNNNFIKSYKTNNIDYNIHFSLSSNSKSNYNSNYNNKYDKFITYKEILIINCSNVEKLIDIDDNNEIKEKDNKKDITNDLLIKEIEDLKEKNKRLLEINIGLNDDIMDLEKQLKEYKEKFDKLSLFFKN